MDSLANHCLEAYLSPYKNFSNLHTSSLPLAETGSEYETGLECETIREQDQHTLEVIVYRLPYRDIHVRKHWKHPFNKAPSL